MGKHSASRHSHFAGRTAALAAVALAIHPASAATYRVIHAFGGANDGKYPLAELVADSTGNLYGTTEGGNANDDGTVFRLSPPAKGSKIWGEEVLHNFGGADGANPESGVLLGSSGAIYGTAKAGGTYDYGLAFRLDYKGSQWVETPLHEFMNPNVQNDGGGPLAGLVLGKGGLLFGTTFDGGNAGLEGTAFSVSPKGDAKEYAVIHNFGTPPDGQLPYPGRLAVNSKNQLFDTTPEGGTNGLGIVYELSPAGGGTWKETILYNFAGGTGDGNNPPSGVSLGNGNVIYGCAPGGANAQGVVYALSPPAQGVKTWTESILYNFGDQSNDPNAGSECAIVVDPSGRLYGTASGGGVYANGAFFELDPPGGGETNWTETVLHSFGSGQDGTQPDAPPMKWKGAYYGVTSMGGRNNAGVAYKIAP